MAAMQAIWIFVAVGLLSVRPALGRPITDDCAYPGRHVLAGVRVPHPPFDAIASGHGCWIFASLIDGQARHALTVDAGIAVLRLRGGSITLVRVVPLSPPKPLGLALTSDGKLLIVADARYVYFLDTE